MATPQRSARRTLDLGQLVEVARCYAERVETGAYPHARFDPDKRWHDRIYSDDLIDVWLITWTPTQTTLLHDHGGSSGAFTVVSGQLDEQNISISGAPVESTRVTGESVAFGPGYIHDVRNLSTGHAVSVHVYSPPLARMNYYELEDGQLVDIGTLETVDPEAEFVRQVA